MNPDYQAIGDMLCHSLPKQADEFILMFRTEGDGQVHVLSSAGDPTETAKLMAEFLYRLRFGRASLVTDFQERETS